MQYKLTFHTKIYVAVSWRFLRRSKSHNFVAAFRLSEKQSSWKSFFPWEFPLKVGKICIFLAFQRIGILLNKNKFKMHFSCMCGAFLNKCRIFRPIKSGGLMVRRRLAAAATHHLIHTLHCQGFFQQFDQRTCWPFNGLQ